MDSSKKNFILFDDQTWSDLLPLTFTKPVSAIRIGILTIKEKWELSLKSSCSNLTRPYLSEKYPLVIAEENILINSAITPSVDLVNEIIALNPGNILVKDKLIVACNAGKEIPENIATVSKLPFNYNQVKSEFIKIDQAWDIFLNNGTELIHDFQLITAGRKSAPISLTNKVLKSENVFIEEGATVECSIINANPGPVYIAKNAEVMEGSVIRGPFALCEYSSLKLGTKIYGPTTVGPNSKVGGEVNNSVIFGFSNKAHDGYLGNSVIGEWCNIGAGSNTSNLKNTYAKVKVWNYNEETFVETNLQFCGLIMGDHSKAGINTMFNTGTVIGVSANIFGAGFPRSFVPSFSWGGTGGFTTYTLSKACETIEIVMKRKNLNFDIVEKKIIEHIFNSTINLRKKIN